MRNGFARQGESDVLHSPAHGGLHGIAGVPFAREQGFYFTPQFRITDASSLEDAGAVFRGALRRAMEQLLDLRPAFGSQLAPIRFAFLGEARLPPSSNRAGR